MQQWLPRWPLQLWAQQWWLTLKDQGLGQARMRLSQFPPLPQVPALGRARRRRSQSHLLHQVLGQVRAPPERWGKQLWRSGLQGSEHESGPSAQVFLAHHSAWNAWSTGWRWYGDSQASRHTRVWFRGRPKISATGKKHLLWVPLAS